jgi:hypothetical protein
MRGDALLCETGKSSKCLEVFIFILATLSPFQRLFTMTWLKNLLGEFPEINFQNKFEWKVMLSNN